MVALPKRKLQDLLQLLDIPTAQRLIGQKYLELLVSKLSSMHLAVQGEVAHLCLIQCNLTKEG